MPRTKRPGRVPKVEYDSGSETEKIKLKLTEDAIQSYLAAVNNEEEDRNTKIETIFNRTLLQHNTDLEEQCIRLPGTASNKTISEIKMNITEHGTTLFETTSLKNITVNTTRAMHASTIKKHKFGTSSTRKEGNTTRDTSASRTRSIVKKVHTTRASRSLSRSKAPTVNSFTTPSANNISAAFGMVTPKVKPNTPQVLLRRPKQGEIAISMQGSPLMVGSITNDLKANVNIPFQDGRVLSIQPQRGLRISQIPELDPELKRQIETLRDNLNKVCALPSRR